MALTTKSAMSARSSSIEGTSINKATKPSISRSPISNDMEKENKGNVGIRSLPYARTNGLELATKVTQMNPEIAVILATGYAELPTSATPLPYARLTKPFTQENLAETLQFATTEKPLEGTIFIGRFCWRSMILAGPTEFCRAGALSNLYNGTFRRSPILV